MTQEARVKLVKKLLAAVDHPTSQPCLIQASRALIDADKLNMEQEKRDQGIADKVDITSGGQPLVQILKATSEFDPDSA
jgi:hypothetical protein